MILNDFKQSIVNQMHCTPLQTWLPRKNEGTTCIIKYIITNLGESKHIVHKFLIRISIHSCPKNLIVFIHVPYMYLTIYNLSPPYTQKKLKKSSVNTLTSIWSSSMYFVVQVVAHSRLEPPLGRAQEGQRQASLLLLGALVCVL